MDLEVLRVVKFSADEVELIKRMAEVLRVSPSEVVVRAVRARSNEILKSSSHTGD